MSTFKNRNLVFSLSVFLSIYVSTAKDVKSDTYTAAVVEYYRYPVDNLPPDEIMNGHVIYYDEILKGIEEPLDIIVFPESTLYGGGSATGYIDFATLIPDIVTDNKLVPCDGALSYVRDFLVALSCLAQNHKVYLVVNVIEKERCDHEEEEKNGETCARNNWNVYNTDVVFNRDGAIIEKYRKFNLFNEVGINRTAKAEIKTFKTDFDVEFGIFTCFDILFPEPALTLVRNGVKHIVFPTLWFSELPFLVSTQSQQMWAQENDVALLAACGNNPEFGSGGSGIYQGKAGAVKRLITTTKGHTVLISQVQKVWNVEELQSAGVKDEVLPHEEPQEAMDDFYLKLDNLTEYTSLYLDTSIEDNSYLVCSDILGVDENSKEAPTNTEDKFCCKFIVITDLDTPTLEANEKSFYHYRMFAFSGVRSFDGAYNGGLEVCAIVACTDPDNFKTCGTRFPKGTEVVWPITFKELIVQANFTKSNTRVQFPNSIKVNLHPLEASQTEWVTSEMVSQSGSFVHRTHKLVTPQKELLTFGIYGRDFSRDSDPLDTGGVKSYRDSYALTFFLLCLIGVVAWLNDFSV